MGLLSETWATWLVASLGSLTILIAGGVLTEIGPWYRGLRKPGWQPADWLFAPAWTMIFAAVTLATVMAWNSAPRVIDALMIVVAFALNGLLNMAWSLIFFKLRRPDWALAEVVALWLSVLLMMIVYYAIIPSAGWLILPYLLWVSFASFLNYTIVRLNGSFGWSGELAPAGGGAGEARRKYFFF